MVTRRQFMGSVSGAMAGIAVGLKPGAAGRVASLPYREAVEDEDFWAEVRRAYRTDPSLINLNNGGVSPATRRVQEAMGSYLSQSHIAPSHQLWKVLEPRKETIRTRLARSFGGDREELAMTRNASESLQTCQFGLDLEPGDEVLTTTQDYGRMITTFQQRERREGIVLRQIKIPICCEDNDLLVQRFEEAITDRTKVILICHMINLTGQVLPVKAIVQMARKRQIPVIVDGAHALAHLDFRLDELDCDYYASSLHKWLCAPHGTGLLYVRRSKIKGLWPLMAAPESKSDNIRKFEEIGTHPAANVLAIGEAIDFHEALGAERKLNRLVFLRDYYVDQLLDNDRFYLNSTRKKGFSGGLANVGIRDMNLRKLHTWLWEKHRIITAAIHHDEFQGLRISPHVYTTKRELDIFCDAMREAVKEGIG